MLPSRFVVVLFCWVVVLLPGNITPVGWANTTVDADNTPEENDLWHTSAHQAKAEEILARLVDANQIQRSPTIWLTGTQKSKNAFASDNDIHITRGILSVIRSDDEFAAIISHELAHCVLRHSQKLEAYLYQQQRKFSAEADNPYSQSPYGTRESLNPKRRLSDFEEETLPSVIRGYEMKADRLGLTMMHKAGYDVDAFIPMMARLTGASGGRGQTHPSSARRQQEARKLVAQLKTPATPAEPPESPDTPDKVMEKGPNNHDGE